MSFVFCILIEYDKMMRTDNSQTFGRKTIANELDNKPIRDLTLTEKDIRPMFVQVQVLERGQYFVSRTNTNSLFIWQFEDHFNTKVMLNPCINCLKNRCKSCCCR